MSCKIVLKS